VRVVVATGRMFRSVRPYLEEAGIDDPVVCYQGAVVAEPATGRFLRHEPIPVELAKEAIAALGRERGFLTSEELLNGVPELDLSPQQIEEFLADPLGGPLVPNWARVWAGMPEAGPRLLAAVQEGAVVGAGGRA